MCWFFPHGTRSRFNDFSNPLKRISSRISLYILLCVWITYRTPVWWLQVTLPWDAAFWSMMISTSPPPKKKQQVKVNFKRKKGKKNESRNLQQHHFNLNWRLAVPYQHSTTLGESFLILKTPSKKKTNKKCCFVCSTNWTESLHIHLSPKGQRQSKERKKNGSKSELRGSFDDIRYSLMMVFSLFYYWVILSVDGTRRTNERLSMEDLFLHY